MKSFSTTLKMKCSSPENHSYGDYRAMVSSTRKNPLNCYPLNCDDLCPAKFRLGTRRGLTVALVLTVSLVLAQAIGCGAAGKSFPKLGGNEAATLSSTLSTLGTPTAEQPVVLAVAVDRSQALAGESVRLTVRGRSAEDWYIYAVATGNESAQMGEPTRLDLQLPAGVRQVSEWQLPPSETKATPLGDIEVYRGDFALDVDLQIAPDAMPGPFQLVCVVHYQACGSSVCQAPSQQTLSVPLTIVANPISSTLSPNG